MSDSPEAARRAKVLGLQIFYDSGRQVFWAPNSRNNWITIGTADVRRWLREKGCRTKPRGEEKVSEIDALLTSLQKNFDVAYAGSLAGHPRGFYENGSHRILVKDSPLLIEPEPGRWPLLGGIIKNMLGAEQQIYLFGWLKVALQSLRSANPRVGQALTLAGPWDCGKSLLQNIFTEILGGRCAKPHRYMSGATSFNGELFEAEHLIIEDEQASTDIRTRRNFGTKIKEITANVTQSCHAKYRQAITLQPFWRLSISVNDEPENLMILPPIDESLQDKLIILKAARHPMPLPSASDKERETFMGALRAELPHLVDFLLKWQIPDNLISPRYGIRHYQHPDILEALGALAPETRFLEMIETELFSSPAPGTWEGKAGELERLLTAEQSKVAREARQLLSFPTACGTYLGRLAKLHPDRFGATHITTGNRWTIEPSPQI
jgi:hypothetical protein